MENFDFNERTVAKEKNVFLLHLDAPRIILICAVIVGIIVTTFLLGMNFSENKVVSHNALITPQLPDDTFGKLDKGIDSIQPLSNQDLSVLDTAPKSNEPLSQLDMLTKKDMDPFPIVKNEDPLTAPVLNQPERKPEPPVLQTPKKSPAREKAAPKRNKVVEVAQTPHEAVRSKPRRSWAIQIASYNTLHKAQREVNSLQSMKFDAYVDKADVFGKTYYRVKIGPILREDKAIGMLQEIQSIERYRESYLVKE